MSQPTNDAGPPEAKAGQLASYEERVEAVSRFVGQLSDAMAGARLCYAAQAAVSQVVGSVEVSRARRQRLNAACRELTELMFEQNDLQRAAEQALIGEAD